MAASRSILEVTGRRTEHIDELVAAVDRAILMEAERGNIATAVRRLAQAEGQDATYNEGLNLIATTLAFLHRVRPDDHLGVADAGLREINQACSDAA